MIKTWIKIALLSVGGPAAQISVMHRVLVEEKKWISERQFLRALNFCMLLPGPEATQLITYMGYRFGGIRGGITAGSLFILPGFLCLLVLSLLYAWLGQLPWVSSLFYGARIAVIAIIVEAVLKMGQRSLQNRTHWVIAGLSFILLLARLPFSLILLGIFLYSFLKDKSPIYIERLDTTPLKKTLTWGIALWVIPIVLLSALFGNSFILTEMSLFFSQVSLVTFGGAYSILSFVSSEVVKLGWLTPQQILDGLALAETTPGPMIQVLQWIGFMGAYQHPAGFNPWVMGISATLLVNWVTYVPAMLWILASAPWMESLLSNPRLGQTLIHMNAAVVGMVGFLLFWFSTHVLDGWQALTILTVSLFLLFRLKWNLYGVLGTGIVLGYLLNGMI